MGTSLGEKRTQEERHIFVNSFIIIISRLFTWQFNFLFYDRLCCFEFLHFSCGFPMAKGRVGVTAFSEAIFAPLQRRILVVIPTRVMNLRVVVFGTRQTRSSCPEDLAQSAHVAFECCITLILTPSIENTL